MNNGQFGCDENVTLVDCNCLAQGWDHSFWDPDPCECNFLVGDADGSGQWDIDDVVYLIAFIFAGGPAPTPYPLASGDANCDCMIDIDDVVYLIAFIFTGGPAPCTVGEWLVNCGPPRFAGDPEGQLIDYDGCKVYESNLMTPDTISSLDCVQNQYDASGTLQLQHINAGFNCCPIIHTDISIDGNAIVISETETFDPDPCWCLCLFDLDYEIVNLPEGIYTIKVEGLYAEPEDYLELTVDLVAHPTGVYCVSRTQYPWGW